MYRRGHCIPEALRQISFHTSDKRNQTVYTTTCVNLSKYEYLTMHDVSTILIYLVITSHYVIDKAKLWGPKEILLT